MRKAVLVAAIVILTPIALSYGVAPARVLPHLMQVDVHTVDEANTMRAVAGIIFAMIGLFACGLARESMRLTALYALLAFTGGLSCGRIVSMLVDGVPTAVPLAYLALEFSTALTVLALLRIHPRDT
ncbi:DUF4345 domain-containing protein [Mycobacterium sp.]|uniref:DUF4345 domain-containing protein n=1 Tax=Mycobacterium sp. TaxID=1785 RepID=UPI003A875B1A